MSMIPLLIKHVKDDEDRSAMIMKIFIRGIQYTNDKLDLKEQFIVKIC